jgi:signal transduction histidine kinase
MNSAASSSSLLARWAVALTARRLVVVLLLCVLAAIALSPIFVTPFTLLLGRTMFVGTALLLVFTVVGHLRQTWLPRWLAQVLAVALVAPLATFVVYLPSVEGDVAALLHNEARVAGLLAISATTMVIGLVMALGALYRERDAQARADSLQFALEKSTLERQALDAQLQLLHAQIEPHFLFNTLANVQALVESHSERAAPVLGQLIAYLRAAMPQLNDADATLGNEVKLVRAYLELMHLRMPDRLQFAIEIEPGLEGLRFPTMALLTLVENAVRHGIDPSEEGGRIEVGGRRDDARGGVVLWVADSGVGLAEMTTPGGLRHRPPGGAQPAWGGPARAEAAASGTGLTNLRARLQAFYGADARLDLHEVSPHGLRAEVVFGELGGTTS